MPSTPGFVCKSSVSHSRPDGFSGTAWGSPLQPRAPPLHKDYHHYPYSYPRERLKGGPKGVQYNRRFLRSALSSSSPQHDVSSRAGPDLHHMTWSLLHCFKAYSASGAPLSCFRYRQPKKLVANGVPTCSSDLGCLLRRLLPFFRLWRCDGCHLLIVVWYPDSLM